jgi:hypothetical protein
MHHPPTSRRIDPPITAARGGGPVLVAPVDPRPLVSELLLRVVSPAPPPFAAVSPHIAPGPSQPTTPLCSDASLQHILCKHGGRIGCRHAPGLAHGRGFNLDEEEWARRGAAGGGPALVSPAPPQLLKSR